ncbi:MAG: ribosome biogenesis GTP-binding protein YihA/YsxC, partial [Acetatifactor sp.]|nr:ribosome biogenesis GTP-binding protein YihA/YsxC [Acetatifactor sp.]
MIIKNAALETVGGITSKLPENSMPEVAFSGKSNVGKSSLINALMNRKSLARTSSQPGKTQTINFYNVNESIYFVDLPGYGYAKVSKSEQTKWAKLLDDFFENKESIAHVFSLCDIRHEPTANDMTMVNYLYQRVMPFTIIATKADKLSRSQIDKALTN